MPVYYLVDDTNYWQLLWNSMENKENVSPALPLEPYTTLRELGALFDQFPIQYKPSTLQGLCQVYDRNDYSHPHLLLEFELLGNTFRRVLRKEDYVVGFNPGRCLQTGKWIIHENEYSGRSWTVDYPDNADTPIQLMLKRNNYSVSNLRSFIAQLHMANSLAITPLIISHVPTPTANQVDNLVDTINQLSILEPSQSDWENDE